MFEIGGRVAASLPLSAIFGKFDRTFRRKNYTHLGTEMAKKVCPRLCDSACWRSGEFTQPRTHFFDQLCMICLAKLSLLMFEITS